MLQLWTTWTYLYNLYPSYKGACQSISIGKSLVLIDGASILQNRNDIGKRLDHLITIAVIQNLSTETNILKTIIDLGSLFNLISQMTVKKMQLARGDQPKQAIHGIDGNLLCTYLEYNLKVFTTNFAGRIICNNRMFLGADIERFNIIIGCLWLWQTSPFINWKNDYWTYY